jgi:beta-glucosidase
MKMNWLLKVVYTIVLVMYTGTLLVEGAASKNDQKIQQIITKMTLDQKAQLVIGTGMFFELPDSIKAKMPPGFGGDVNTKDPVYNEMVKRIRIFYLLRL